MAFKLNSGAVLDRVDELLDRAVGVDGIRLDVQAAPPAFPDPVEFARANPGKTVIGVVLLGLVVRKLIQ